MSRPTPPLNSAPIPILAPQVESILAMARVLPNWSTETRERANTSVITSPAGKRITVPHDVKHSDWPAKVESQVKHSGLPEAFARFRKAQAAADLAAFEAKNADALASTAVPTGEAVQQPSPDAAESTLKNPLRCSECDFLAKAPAGLGAHKRHSHGIVGEWRKGKAAVSPVRPASTPSRKKGDPDVSFSAKIPSQATPVPKAAPSPPSFKPPVAPPVDPSGGTAVSQSDAHDEMAGFETALGLLREEMQNVLSEAKKNAPDPAVEEEAQKLRDQLAELTQKDKNRENLYQRLLMTHQKTLAELKDVVKYRAAVRKAIEGKRPALAIAEIIGLDEGFFGG